ncbi:MAG: CRISPR-associated protein Csx19 [Lachnospiraceae bacterium]|nr:CRISPR-associated protein Csx19 [Lachnospiraceae bacterium]
MSTYVWMKESGTIKEEELSAKLQRYHSENELFLAYSTDSFCAGHALENELSELHVKQLLELRIFSENKELYYCRSRMGEDFQWRLASEENLEKDYYMIQYQTLDINTAKMEQDGFPTDTYGNLILYTTVGGKYKLPISREDNCSKIIAYIDYDEYGMAKIKDYRLCGFLYVKEEKQNG